MSIVEEISDKLELAKENQRSRFEKFNDFDYVYHSRLKKPDPNVPSKVVNPVVWSFIETIVTRMLSKNPKITYKPRERDDKVQADLLSELFDYWWQKSGAYIKIVSWVKDALIYGTGIVKVDWHTSPTRIAKAYETDEISGEALLDDNGEFVVREEEVVDYDDPRITNVNIYDFYFDPNAQDIDDAEWVLHQYYVSYADLENRGDYYDSKSLKKLKRMQSDNGDNESDMYDRTRRDAAGFTDQNDYRSKDKIKIWEYWENDRCVVIANESVVLKDRSNPFWHGKKPFVRIVDYIVPLEFYGKGEIEPIEKMFYALQTVINQRITNVSQILSPVWLANGNVDDYELQFIPNNIIHVDNIGTDVATLRPNDVTSSSYQEQSVIIETMQRALGVTDYVQGLQTPGQTAAEVQVKTSQANARFAHKVQIMEEMGLKRIGDLVYSLYQQYITTEKTVRVAGEKGEKFVRITPRDLVGHFDVIPESSSTVEVDEENDFRKWMGVYGMLAGKPHINMIELDKETLERAGEKDVDKYFVGQSADGAAIAADRAAGGALPLNGTVPPTGPIGGPQPPAGIGGISQFPL